MGLSALAGHGRAAGALGVGHQRMCLGSERRAGDAARDPRRVQRCAVGGCSAVRRCCPMLAGAKNVRLPVRMGWNAGASVMKAMMHRSAPPWVPQAPCMQSSERPLAGPRPQFGYTSPGQSLLVHLGMASTHTKSIRTKSSREEADGIVVTGLRPAGQYPLVHVGLRDSCPGASGRVGDLSNPRTLCCYRRPGRGSSARLVAAGHARQSGCWGGNVRGIVRPDDDLLDHRQSHLPLSDDGQVGPVPGPAGQHRRYHQRQAAAADPDRLLLWRLLRGGSRWWDAGGRDRRHAHRARVFSACRFGIIAHRQYRAGRLRRDGNTDHRVEQCHSEYRRVPADPVGDGGTAAPFLLGDRAVLDRAHLLRGARDVAGLARRAGCRVELCNPSVPDFQLSRSMAGGHGIGHGLHRGAGDLLALLEAEACDARRDGERRVGELSRSAGGPGTSRAQHGPGDQGMDAVAADDGHLGALGHSLGQESRAQLARHHLLGMAHPRSGQGRPARSALPWTRPTPRVRCGSGESCPRPERRSSWLRSSAGGSWVIAQGRWWACGSRPWAS